MTIAQIELQSFFLVLAAILGFISASAVDLIKDWNARRRMRGALYREIGEMYYTLRWAVDGLKEGVENWSVLSVTYELLQHILGADAYVAAKALPVLSYRIKDFPKISVVYTEFSMYNTFCRGLGVYSLAFRDNTDDQTAKLKTACESVIDIVEEQIKRLDRELLLKASRPEAQRDLRELFERVEKAKAVEEKQAATEEPAEGQEADQNSVKKEESIKSE
ncbi:MAG: hypothetical protein WCG09_00635 [Halobacteriota archaeon]